VPVTGAHSPAGCGDISSWSLICATAPARGGAQPSRPTGRVPGVGAGAGAGESPPVGGPVQLLPPAAGGQAAAGHPGDDGGQPGPGLVGPVTGTRVEQPEVFGAAEQRHHRVEPPGLRTGYGLDDACAHIPNCIRNGSDRRRGVASRRGPVSEVSDHHLDESEPLPHLGLHHRRHPAQRRRRETRRLFGDCRESRSSVDF
jgi:hypothetical protein